MFISNEEKRRIMEELARGNPEMLIQESSSNFSQSEQKLKDDTCTSEDVTPMPDSKSHNTQEKLENDLKLIDF